MNLKNKVALVTGGAKRVGKTIALALAERGAHVAVHYRSSKSEAEKTAREIQALGVKAKIYKADLTRVPQLKKMVETISKQLGPVDILINSASIYEETPLSTLQEKNWNAHIDTNLKGAFFLAKFCAVTMLKRKTGKIINIIDSDIHHPYNHYLPYMVSKSGLAGLTVCLARELAPHIQVNGISPGPVLMQPDWDKTVLEDIIKVTPLSRIGHPQDIANGVLFCLEGTDFMTGAIIPIDGGQHIA